MDMLRLEVEQSNATFTGYRVIVRWNNGFGWRSTSFTSWIAVFKFLRQADDSQLSMYTINVRSMEN